MNFSELKNAFFRQFTIILASFLIASLRESFANASIFDNSLHEIISFILMYYISIYLVTIGYIAIYGFINEKILKITKEEIDIDYENLFKLEPFRLSIIVITCIVFIWIVMNWPANANTEMF